MRFCALHFFNAFQLLWKVYEINVSSFSSHWTIVPHTVFQKKNARKWVAAVFLYMNVADTFLPSFTRIGHHCAQYFPLHVVIESNRVCAWIKANKRRLKSRGRRIKSIGSFQFTNHYDKLFIIIVDCCSVIRNENIKTVN